MTRRRRIGLLALAVLLTILWGCAPARTTSGGPPRRRVHGIPGIPRVLGGAADACEPVTLTSQDAIAVAGENELPEGLREWHVAAERYLGRCAWVVTSYPTRESSQSLYIDSETGEVLIGFFLEAESIGGDAPDLPN